MVINYKQCAHILFSGLKLPTCFMIHNVYTSLEFEPEVRKLKMLLRASHFIALLNTHSSSEKIGGSPISTV